VATDVRPDLRTPTVPSRLLGFGSVFGKAVRDGRQAALAVGVLAAVMLLSTAAALAAEWPTAELRRELVASMELLPVFLRGLLGDPIRIDTLGGFMSWRIGNILPVILGVWSVLALSGTLATEARRGSLDLVVAAPISRWRIAAEKVTGHVVLVVVAMLIAAVVVALAAGALGTIPGDEVPLSSAIEHLALTALLMFAPGALAFAAAPYLGQGRAAGVGFVALFGGYLIASYRTLSDLIAGLEPLSWYAWTAAHRPLAGQTDWPPVVLLAFVTLGLMAIGVVGFVRRDVGSTVRGLGPGIGLPAGTGGPFRRQLAERAGMAIGVGLGIGIYGTLIAASAEQFAEGLGQMPGIDALIERLYPGVDIGSPSGILQLAFFAFGSLLLSLAAAAFVGGLAADENGKRLDVILAAPLARFRWFVAAGLGVFAALVVATVVMGVLIGVGVAASGGDVGGPIAGSAVLVLYGAAFAGIGIAIVGLGWPRLAALATGSVAITSYLLGVLGNALGLPDWLVDLALSEHVGQPMAGQFDVPGMIAMVVLGAGGLAVGAIGFGRRDLGT
jgi:ABC-2 type transport system permease protein